MRIYYLFVTLPCRVQKRLWVIDLKNKKLLQHSLVAHGMGTGDEYATAFQINPNHTKVV